MNRPGRDPQERYARTLAAGSRLVFAFGSAVFAMYLAGLLPAFLPLQDLPRLWTLPAAELPRASYVPGGAGWLELLRYGDYLNLVAIAGFSLLSLVCMARVVPAFLQNGERLNGLLAALQAIVLLAAALNPLLAAL